MTAVPPEALAAAFEACPFINRDAATRLLEAAAPHIRADANNRACRIAAEYLDGNVWREFADHIRSGDPP